MSAATGGGMGIKRYTADKEESERADGEFILHADHVAALQELQARNAELERRVLIAEKKFELCNESRNRLTRFASSSEFWDVEAIGALIAEGKIQPTEQGGNN